MAKKKEKRRSLLDKIRGLETETHPKGKRVGQLFQAVAAGEIEVSFCVLLFLEMLFILDWQALFGNQSHWRIGGGRGAKTPPVQFFFQYHAVFCVLHGGSGVFHEGGVSPRDHYTIW